MILSQTASVEEALAGNRLDLFLVRRFPSTSRALAIEAIAAGRVLLNARPAKKGARVKTGDTVTVAELAETADWKASPNPSLRIPILHEETSFLVADKPSGLPVHPLHPRETGTVISGLLAAYPELAGIGPDPLLPAVVHRLDAETSGVLLVARNAAVYANLRAQFAQRRVLKKYIALACGGIESPARMEDLLAHSFRGTHRMVVVDASSSDAGRRPMRAVTEYSIRERLPRHTLLDVVIHTGVTHQIRCQLSARGHAIAGDGLYGNREADAGYSGRMFLHAAEIAFQHPETGRQVSFCSEFPPDLLSSLEQVR